MERAEKTEWFERVRDRYQRGTKTEKRALLDSLVKTLGVHRKSAIRLLRNRNPGRRPKAKRSIDRQLKPYKALLKRRGGTKPGSLLKTEIPIQGSVWDITTPGFLEADTVAHFGNSMHGEFVWSLTMTGINTQWTQCGAVWHKGAKGVVEQVKDIEKSLHQSMREVIEFLERRMEQLGLIKKASNPEPRWLSRLGEMTWGGR